jgi:hypothetical protein
MEIQVLERGLLQLELAQVDIMLVALVALVSLFQERVALVVLVV